MTAPATTAERLARSREYDLPENRQKRRRAELAARLRSAQKCIHEGTATVTLPGSLEHIRENRDWEHWPASNGKPFASFQKWLRASQPFGLGISQYNGNLTAAQCWQLAKGFSELQAELMPLVIDEAEPLAKVGDNQHGGRGCNNGTSSVRGNSPEYLLSRLKREADNGSKAAAESLKRLASGELKSIRQAAIAAGIIKATKKPDPFERLKADWQEAGEEYRVAFLAFLTDQGEIKTLNHPLRIQRTRTKGARLPNDAVCVTRPGKWGNPFDTAPEFRSWLAGGPRS